MLKTTKRKLNAENKRNIFHENKNVGIIISDIDNSTHGNFICFVVGFSACSNVFLRSSSEINPKPIVNYSVSQN